MNVSVDGILAVEARISEIRQRMAQVAPEASPPRSFAATLDAAMRTYQPGEATSSAAVRWPSVRTDRSEADTWIREAIAATGVPSDWAAGLRAIAEHESGLNRNAYNGSTGTREPAVGLMQTLPSTFRAHALPGHTDIYDPVDNLMAAIGYIRARYGNPGNTPGLRSLAQGGRYRGY